MPFGNVFQDSKQFLEQRPVASNLDHILVLSEWRGCQVILACFGLTETVFGQQPIPCSCIGHQSYVVLLTDLGY